MLQRNDPPQSSSGEQSSALVEPPRKECVEVVIAAGGSLSGALVKKLETGFAHKGARSFVSFLGLRSFPSRRDAG